MTTYKGTPLQNGDILSMKTNVGASPRYFLNDTEITMSDYYFYLTEDNVEKNLEVIQAANSTYWTLLRKFFRFQK
jgi:hypothetical protein